MSVNNNGDPNHVSNTKKNVCSFITCYEALKKSCVQHLVSSFNITPFPRSSVHHMAAGGDSCVHLQCLCHPTALGV